MKTISFHGDKNIVFNRVKHSRERLGLSQEELAVQLQVMGVSIDQQAISRIELNSRIVTDYELLCMAKALKVKSAYLLGED